HAFSNLMKNGLDASANDDEVAVTGRIRERVFELEIADRGHGIEREVLDRVGEPFFTTKEAGRGMGLGLFVTQAVIERVGGRIELDSQVGRGTTVTVSLPMRG
ncbi:MAG: ATP-binding protein, partial [Myxococcota bacterium]